MENFIDNNGVTHLAVDQNKLERNIDFQDLDASNDDTSRLRSSSELIDGLSEHIAIEDEETKPSKYCTGLFVKAEEFNDNSDILGMDLLSDDDYKKNPRSIIRFLRGQSFCYYHIETAYSYFITGNIKIDPYTRQTMSKIDLDRIRAYYDYYLNYKDLEVTVSTIKETLQKLFKPDQSPEELAKTISLAKGIIQPEDIVKFISDNINSGNPIDRVFTEEYLKTKPVNTFLFRISSLGSTEHAKVFIMSVRKTKDIMHVPYVHIYGRGLFEMDPSKFTTGYKLPQNPDLIPVLCDKVYVSIIDLLLDPKLNLLQTIHNMGPSCPFY